MLNSSLRWIEARAEDRATVERLGKELGIHPLAIEDCLHSNQRAKFEEFEGHFLLVWFVFLKGKVYELEFVVFPGTVLLVTSDAPPKGESWREYLQISTTHVDANHLLYQALDRAMDYSTQNVLPLFDAIDEFEDNLLSKTSDPRELLRLKRQLNQAEFALGYLSSVVGQWQRYLNPKDDLRWRLRDLWDHCERFHQAVVFHRMQIATAMDMYWGETARRTNDQIKKLTLIASFSVPLGFWTSFWGMNFTALPFDKPWAIPLALGLMALSAVFVYFILRKKGIWGQK